MLKARVLFGGWFWHGRQYKTGSIVHAPAAQIKSWARDGIVEVIVEPKPKPPPKVETSEAPEPPENAAKQTGKRKTRARKKSVDDT